MILRRIRKQFRFHLVFAGIMLGALLASPLLGYHLGPN